MINWTAVWRFLTATDERTWIGHGLQGLLFGFLGGLTRRGNGAIFTFGAFLHRETDDYFAFTRKWSAVLDHPGFTKIRRERMVDGYMDLWSPMFGAFLGEFLAEILRP